MAILNTLLVNGASRFLSHAYFEDISVSGSTSIPNLTARTLTVTETSTFNNAATFQNGVELTGGNPHIDFHYNNSTADYTSRIVEIESGLLNFPKNIRVNENSYLQNVQVLGKIRWASVAENCTIQNLGGTFMVSPTIFFTSATKVTINSISDTTVAMTVVDNSIASNSIGGSVWKQYSHLRLCGRIGDCVLGASEAYLTQQLNTTAHTMNISATIENAAKLTAGVTYTGSQIQDFSVMMYRIGNGSQTVNYPIGVFMTAYGDNNKSYIDVYGGTDVNAVVRMGNLGGLKYIDSSGTQQTLANQWGFYTKGNTYIEGHIVAASGRIAGWTIGEKSLYKGNLGASGGVHLVPAGSEGTANIGGSGNLAGWAITSGATFGVTTAGAAYMSSGKIGGWTISASEIKSGTDNVGTGVHLLQNGSTDAIAIGGSTAIKTWAITSSTTFGVTNAGALYATSGKIGGWSITAGNLSYGSIGTANGVFLIPAGSETTISIAGSGAINGWTITSGTTFGVTKAGALYSTSGKIGGWTIGTSSIYNNTNSMTSTTAGLYLGTDGIRVYKDATTYVNIQNGKITASGAEIGGKLTAGAGSTIGPWTISATDISNGNTTFGTGGLSFGSGGVFKVTPAGAVTASSGTIGPWTLGSTAITNGNISLGSSGININSVFVVDSDGYLTSTSGQIGGFYIGTNSIYNGEASGTTAGYIALSTTDFARTINGSNRALRFAIGGNFGIADDGKMYCSSGDLGGWIIDSDSIRKGNKTGTNDGDTTLSTTDFTRSIGGVSRASLRFAIGGDFGVNKSGTLYAADIVANNSYSIRGKSSSFGGVDFEFVRAYATSNSARLVGIGTAFTNDHSDDTYIWPSVGISIDQGSSDSGVGIHADYIQIAGEISGNTPGDTQVSVNGPLTVFGDLNIPSLAQGNISCSGSITSSGTTTAQSFSATNNGGTQYSVRYENTTNTYASAAAIVITDAVTMGINGTDTLNTWVRYGPAQDSCLLMKPGNSQIFVRAKASASGSVVTVYNLADCLEAALAAGGAIQSYGSAPPAIASSGSAGSENKYARGDHTHGITVTQGSNNGEISIAGTSVKPKGWGSAATKDTSYFATASSLSNYATTSDLSSYATTSSLSSYAKLSGATFTGSLITTGTFKAQGTTVNFSGIASSSVNDDAQPIGIFTSGNSVGNVKLVPKSAKRYKIPKGYAPDSEGLKLLDIPVIKYIYKPELMDPECETYKKVVVGMYADDVEEIVGYDAVFHNADGLVENYRDRQILVRLVKLAQIQHREIEELKSRLSILEGSDK